MSWTADVQYQNRTANSVQVRVKWTTNIIKNYYIVYGQNFKATSGSATTGVVKVAAFNYFGKSGSGSARSATATSGWITVPLNTTDATTIPLSIYYYQTNSLGTDMNKYDGTAAVNTSWTVNIPAY